MDLRMLDKYFDVNHNYAKQITLRILHLVSGTIKYVFDYDRDDQNNLIYVNTLDDFTLTSLDYDYFG